MVQVNKRERESVNSLVRRFMRTVQQSGVLIRAKKSKFYEKDLTKRQMRERALHREKKIQEMEKLKKLGILEEKRKKGFKGGN